MIKAQYNEDTGDMMTVANGDMYDVMLEMIFLIKNIGKHLEEVTGTSSRTHIVNICKLIIDDDMTPEQVDELVEKTINDECVPLDEEESAV
jgi:hypothetical protein